MRFIAFFTFVATANAITSIFPNTQSNCHPQVVLNPIIDRCGDTILLDHDIRGARIVYDGQKVIWYDSSNGVGCKGRSASVQTSTDCYTLPFSPACVRILC